MDYLVNLLIRVALIRAEEEEDNSPSTAIGTAPNRFAILLFSISSLAAGSPGTPASGVCERALSDIIVVHVTC